MKYKLIVKIPFTDKNTGESYKAGEEITVEKSRGDELLADRRGLVDLVEKLTEKRKKQE